MSAHEISRKYDTGYAVFVIDDESDLAVFRFRPLMSEDLPNSEKYGSMGSVAKSISGNSYILNGDGEWVIDTNPNDGMLPMTGVDINNATE